MTRFLESRDLLASGGGAITGMVALQQWPFPGENAMLGFIQAKPRLGQRMK